MRFSWAHSRGWGAGSGSDSWCLSLTHPTPHKPHPTSEQPLDRDPPARVAEREVASAIVHGGTPIRPLFRGWVRGGSVTEGPRSNDCSNFQGKEKRGVT